MGRPPVVTSAIIPAGVVAEPPCARAAKAGAMSALNAGRGMAGKMSMRPAIDSAGPTGAASGGAAGEDTGLDMAETA